jgi:serine/threonine protein kinase
MSHSETAERIVPDANGNISAGAPAERDPLLGSVVDSRYLIERVVGSGGFGVVYRAVHLRFDSPVAIKVLRMPSRLSDDERRRFIDLFLAEGKLLFTLGAVHPSIVRVFEAGTLHAADGLLAPYLVMEWLDGMSLDEEIRNRAERGAPQWILGQVIDLLSFCAEGLARAHEMRIAHHDIKPGNIFLVQQDKRLATKLVDFGLAKASHDTVTTSAGQSADGSPGACAFTPAYGAPEQWLRRLGATGTWTDVYALALVCVELLAGRRALHGQAATQLMAACLDENARPTPRALGVAVSDGVEAVFQRALCVDPRQRYRDARSFWEALQRSARPESNSFRRNAYVVVSMAAALSLMPSTSERPAPEPSARASVPNRPRSAVVLEPAPSVETAAQSIPPPMPAPSPLAAAGHAPRRRPVPRTKSDQPITNPSREAEPTHIEGPAADDTHKTGATDLERLLNLDSLSRRK